MEVGTGSIIIVVTGTVIIGTAITGTGVTGIVETVTVVGGDRGGGSVGTLAAEGCGQSEET